MTTRNSSSTSSEESQPMPDFDWENSPNNLFTLDKNKFIISKFLNNQLFKPSNMKRFKPKRMKRSSKRSKGESLATTSYDLESPNLHSPVRNNINIATQSIADDITENMEECTEEQVLCEEINNMYYDFSENITKNLSTELDVVTVIESSSEANSCEENIEIEYDDNMVGTEEVQILDAIEPIFHDYGYSSNQSPTPEITNETETAGTISCEENIEIEYEENMVETEEVQILDTIEPIFHDYGYSSNQSPTPEITNETETAGTISCEENIEIEYEENMVETEEVQILDTIEPIFHDYGYSSNQSPTPEITNETETAGTISCEENIEIEYDENMVETEEVQILDTIEPIFYDHGCSSNQSPPPEITNETETSGTISCEENIEIEYDDNMVGTEEVQILDTIEPIFYDHGCSSNQLPTPEITNETQTSGTISCEENIEIEYDDNMVGTEEVQILDTIEPIFHDHGYSFNQSPTHEITNETKTAGTISSDVIDLCESNESTESIDELENSFNSNNSTNFSSDNSGNKENAVVGQNKINLLSNIRVSPPHECTIKPSNNDVLLPNENYVAVYNELQAVKNEVNSLRTEVANLRQRMEEIKRINMEAFKSLYETIRERKWKKKRSKKHKRSRSKREKY